MNLPFTFDKIAAGSSIIGRDAELAFIGELLEKGSQSVAVYGGPRSGKETIATEAVERYRESHRNLILCRFDLTGVRSREDFTALWRSRMKECASEVNRHAILPFDISVDNVPDSKVFDLPGVIASESASPMIIYFKEFQNILETEGDGFALEALEKSWSRQRGVKFIFTGSRINAMKNIFEQRKCFYSMCRTLEMQPVDRKLVCEYIRNSFLSYGRVIEMEEAMAINEMTPGNMWYVKQLCFICCAMPAGYVNRKIVNQARDILLSIHSPRFKAVVFDLTANQMNLLHAVVDGVSKFTGAEVMERYRLNSSANVARIKEALQKKEVISFDEDDNARIIDPLFEYWLRNYYF